MKSYTNYFQAGGKTRVEFVENAYPEGIHTLNMDQYNKAYSNQYKKALSLGFTGEGAKQQAAQQASSSVTQHIPAEGVLPEVVVIGDANKAKKPITTNTDLNIVDMPAPTRWTPEWTVQDYADAKGPDPKILHGFDWDPYDNAYVGSTTAALIGIPMLATAGLGVIAPMAAETGIGGALSTAGRAIVKNAPKLASNKLVADATKTGILTRAAQKFTDWKTNHPTLYKYGKWGAIGGAGYEALNMYGKSGGTGDSGSDGEYDTYNITDGDMTPGE